VRKIEDKGRKKNKREKGERKRGIEEDRLCGLVVRLPGC
jgi:hypothetical protein